MLPVLIGVWRVLPIALLDEFGWIVLDEHAAADQLIVVLVVQRALCVVDRERAADDRLATEHVLVENGGVEGDFALIAGRLDRLDSANPWVLHWIGVAVLVDSDHRVVLFQVAHFVAVFTGQPILVDLDPEEAVREVSVDSEGAPHLRRLPGQLSQFNKASKDTTGIRSIND